MKNAALRGKPDAGNPHVRFDEGDVAPAKPRRGSLLYKTKSLVRAAFIAASLFAIHQVGFAAPKVTVLDLGIEAGKPGPFGCPSAPASFVRALGGAYDVRVVAHDRIDAEGAFDRARTDLVVIPSGSLFPAAQHLALVDYLRKGGHLLTTGGYAFDKPLYFIDGAWQVEKPAPKLPLATPTQPVVMPPAAKWREMTYPGTLTRITDITGPDGAKGIRVATPKMVYYNCGVFSLPPMPKDAGALAFRLRGDGKTQCAAIEVNEKDGTRWRSESLPLADDWREYALDWTDFSFHKDSPTRTKGRGGVNDRIDFSKAVAVCVCITRTGNGLPGDPRLTRLPRWIEVCDLRVGPDTSASARVRNVTKPIPEINGRAWKKPLSGRQTKGTPPLINVFFPYYHYENVARFANAPETAGLYPPFAMKGAFAGWDASAMLTEARHGHAPDCVELRPLVTGYDADGRCHGFAGSVVRHYGDAFKGGSWAIFGVESEDIFATPANDAFLKATVDALFEPVWLSEPHPEYVTARVGETAKFLVNVRNYGAEDKEGEVVFTLSDEEGQVVFEKSVAVRAKAKGVTEASCTWPVGAEARDYYDLKVEYRACGRTIDRAFDALAVWKPETIARGPVLRRDGARFTINGKARFALGAQPMMARTQGHSGRSARHQHEEFRTMHEAGLVFSRNFWGFNFQKSSLDQYETRQSIRSMDATVLFAQKFGIVMYFNVSCGNNIPALDKTEEVKREAGWHKFFAERYRDVPGIMFDIRNEAVVSRVPGRSRADHAEWFRRWAAEAAGAIWEANAKAPVSTGWCQGWKSYSNSVVVDPPSCNEPLNFTDCHYYGPGEDYSEEIKKVDRRVFGYPAIVGEFGCAFNPEGFKHMHQYVTDAAAERRYVQQALRAFGLGYQVASNYGWVDQIQGQLSFSFLQRDFYPRNCLATYCRLDRTLARIDLAENRPDTVLLISQRRLDEDKRTAEKALAGYNLAAAALAWCGANYSCVPEAEAGKLPTDLKCVLKSSDFEDLAKSMDPVAARVRTLSALKASGAFFTRRTEDDAELESYFVPGKNASAWVFWNDGFDLTLTTSRAGRTISIAPQHGHYLEIGPDGAPTISVGF